LPQEDIVEVHPPEPLLVHRLPPAPHFVGRQAELEELHTHWAAGTRGVVALVGLGGAGKTAVAARFLDAVLSSAQEPRPESLLVWSFYQVPDAGRFLEAACAYFSPGSAVSPAKGVAVLPLLRDALARGGPHLLVLDGLERVQRQEGDAAAAYGQVEDALLKQLLSWLAEGVGRVTVLVTSRFPLTDLELYRGRGYRHVDVGGLDVPAGIALLRARGVGGEDVELEQLISGYGAHALTLDHLGGLIGQFLGGDPRRAPEAPALASPGTDRQAFRLVRLLRAYEEHLPPAELALFCRLCLLRRSLSAERICHLFLCSPSVQLRTVRELGEALRRLPRPDNYSEERFYDLVLSVQGAVEHDVVTAALAGPEEVFCRAVAGVVGTILELHEEAADVDIAGLARRYFGDHLEVVSHERPLSVRDRRRLRELCARYVLLTNHPLMPTSAPAPVLKKAFQDLGYGKGPWPDLPLDLDPIDLLAGVKQVREELRHLAFKHAALKRVRELRQLHQRKWSLAGPLAPLIRTELLQALHSLVGRHLVLRESDGSFSVHPAVRDHFGRLGSAGEQGQWHEVLREQLISLAKRPGRRLPEDSATLDLMEEAVYHCLQAGKIQEAVGLYEHALGGLRHLGWKLGEMTRGVRILRGFPTCPDRWALGWFLRALGEYEEAWEHNPLPCFRADIRLLQGRLPDVAAEGESTRTAVAAFLMGESTQLPPECLAAVVPRALPRLYRGELHRVGRAADLTELYRDIGWEGDHARCQLIHAEAARRMADQSRSQARVGAVEKWVVNSGSVEHLVLLHLVKARLARTLGHSETAQHNVDAGLRLARQCGLGLYLLELLCEQAEVCLARADVAAAESFAAAALERATSPQCQFLWGAAEAGHLLGFALFQQGQMNKSRRHLEQVRTWRRQLLDPKLEATQQLLARLT
jgi:hypothetical protein